MLIYRAEMYILMKYPHLIDLNKKNSDIAQKISDNSKFFIIKSFSEEDVHKAIKYNVWSSTRNGNKTLHETYKQTKENSGEVYLFFRLIINLIKLQCKWQICWLCQNELRSRFREDVHVLDSRY